jgi:hypothetical protein
MAITHVPGSGLGGAGLGPRGRRAAVIAAVVLACAAILVPFGIHALRDDAPPATAATHQTVHQAVASHPRHHTVTDGVLGSRADLPSLLPAAGPGLQDGATVRVGDITTGVVHRSPTGAWQVVVRWDGQPQPLTAQGPVSLGAGSWVSRAGLLYSRVATGTPGRFRVYAWDAQGGTAYTPPSLVATSLGPVCFNQTFTAFGGCTR